RLFHALVDLFHEIAASLLGELGDVQPDDRTVHVGHQADVALEDRLLDGTEDGPIPRLDHDLVRFGHADPGKLVEGRLGAVVLDVEPLDQRRRGTPRPNRLEVALHHLDRARHLALDAGQHFTAHARIPPTGALDEMSVPTRSPIATRVTLSGWFRSNT